MLPTLEPPKDPESDVTYHKRCIKLINELQDLYAQAGDNTARAVFIKRVEYHESYIEELEVRKKTLDNLRRRSNRLVKKLKEQ